MHTAFARWRVAACARSACWPRRPHYALDHHVERLADDHALAQRLAAGIAGHCGPDGCALPRRTSCLWTWTDGRGPDLLAHLKVHGVLATGLIGLRFVTHLDVDAAGIDHAHGLYPPLSLPVRHPLRQPLPAPRGAGGVLIRTPDHATRSVTSVHRGRRGCSTSRPGPDVLYIVSNALAQRRARRHGGCTGHYCRLLVCTSLQRPPGASARCSWQRPPQHSLCIQVGGCRLPTGLCGRAPAAGQGAILLCNLGAARADIHGGKWRQY